MSDKKLAAELVKFFKGIPEEFDDLQSIIINKLATISKKAEMLQYDIFVSEAKFLNTIIDIIFLLKKTPALFQPFFRAILKPILSALLTRIDKNWYENIKDRTKLVSITDGKINIADA